MSDPLSISNETLVLVNVGTIVAAGGIYTRMVYLWAKLELTQQFQKEQLNQAFTKIRDLEKRLNDKNG